MWDLCDLQKYSGVSYEEETESPDPWCTVLFARPSFHPTGITLSCAKVNLQHW